MLRASIVAVKSPAQQLMVRGNVRCEGQDADCSIERT
jgi:hypothetical protein